MVAQKTFQATMASCTRYHILATDELSYPLGVPEPELNWALKNMAFPESDSGNPAETRSVNFSVAFRTPITDHLRPSTRLKKKVNHSRQQKETTPLIEYLQKEKKYLKTERENMYAIQKSTLPGSRTIQQRDVLIG